MDDKTRTMRWCVAAAILVLPALGLAANKSMLSKVQTKLAKPAAVAVLQKALESEEELMDKLDKIMSKDSTKKTDTENAWSTAMTEHAERWEGLVVKATNIQRGGGKRESGGLPGSWPTGYEVWGTAQVKFLNEVVDKKKGHMMIRFRRQSHALVEELKQRIEDDNDKITDVREKLTKIDEDVRRYRRMLSTYKTSKQVAQIRMSLVNRAWNKTYALQEFLTKRQKEVKAWVDDARNDPKTYQKYMTQIKNWKADVAGRAWLEPRCKKSLETWETQCKGRNNWHKSKWRIYTGLAAFFTNGMLVDSKNRTFDNVKWDKLTEPVGKLLAEYLARENELKAAGK